MSVGADSTIPSSFSQRVPENLVTIIQWLVENDPAKRPSALELQNSPLMPPRIELDKLYLEEVMSVLRHNSDTVQSVITTLFTRKHPLGVQGGLEEDSEETLTTSSYSSNSGISNYHFNYDCDLYSRSLRLVNPVPSPSSSSLAANGLSEGGGGQRRQQHQHQQAQGTASVSTKHAPLPPLAASSAGHSVASPLQLHDAIASLAEKVQYTPSIALVYYCVVFSFHQ
jgi:hypothetical protein